MVRRINIDESLKSKLPIIDVRSPGEYEKGHIPNAINIPLFSDEERAAVGLVYKNQSQQAAIDLGYQFVTPKLNYFISRAFEVAPNGKATVHCWRGGMRSQAFAEHLSVNNFQEVLLVDGGYKSFRNYVLASFETPLKILVLGGYAGSGKSLILKELENQGEQIIDLEGLAFHKGSAFGGIGQGQQPSFEQFENNLFYEISKLKLDSLIWIEDESHNIGQVKIPRSFFNQMRNSKLIFLEIPKDERARHLVDGYATCGDKHLEEGIFKISKRLGGLGTKVILNFLAHKDYYNVALMTLDYYDKYYLRGLQKRSVSDIIRIKLEKNHILENTLKILNTIRHNEQHKINSL